MARRRHPERGFTLVEVMISSLILVVAMVGFLSVMQHTLASNRVAHRRTVATQVRTGMLDRLTVTPRLGITSLPQNAWFIDECYDVDARLSGVNLLRDAAYACPDGSFYRRWLQVVPVAGASSTWQVGLYVERIDNGCTPDTRFASTGCVAADTYLTD